MVQHYLLLMIGSNDEKQSIIPIVYIYVIKPLNHTNLVGLIAPRPMSSFRFDLVSLLIDDVTDGLSNLVLPAVRHNQWEVLV